jgi:hypothetical protein
MICGLRARNPTPTIVRMPARPEPSPEGHREPSMLFRMPPMPPCAKSWTTRPDWSIVWPKPATPCFAFPLALSTLSSPAAVLVSWSSVPLAMRVLAIASCARPTCWAVVKTPFISWPSTS